MMRRRHFWRMLHSLYLWHRYLGLTFALFLLLLAVTGLILNHSEEMQLDEARIDSGWLLDLYGIGEPIELQTFHPGDQWLTRVDDRIYLDRQPLGIGAEPLMDAIEYEGRLLLVMGRALWWLEKQGKLIERLDTFTGLPGSAQALGLSSDGGVRLKTEQGWFEPLGKEMLEWRPTEMITFSPLRDLSAPPGLTSALVSHYRSQQLHLERLLLELHTGRLFGGYGPLLMDVAAIVLIFSILSGIWIVLIRNLKAHQWQKRANREERRS